jgi:putative ABC transport system substrate-binding protein
MRRREFIATLAAAAAVSPSSARAQQAKTPVVGFLHSGSRAENVKRLEAFLKGLDEAGFVDGRNVAIEYRWADGRADRLEELAADLVRRRVALVATAGSTAATVAAKKATAAVPIVFAIGADPVALGLVASLGHPGGNVTGVNSLNAALGAKRLSLMRQLAPQAARWFTLINPTSPVSEAFLDNLQTGAAALGVRVDVLRAASEREIDAVFASLPEAAGGAFLSSPDAFFYSRREQIVALVSRHALPSMFDVPEYVEAGGLASYGNDFLDAMRLAGSYVGRILKGEKPAELPVVQAEKFVMALNLKTAKALGLDIPQTLLAAADEVIE